ncbi:MAG: DHHA1 domain-containing protein, partial [Bacteroidota bacterium]|nr:DHHA1 domain-containing protein [Bacteroidota bacterium]MDX5430780.1 DHHA1 domain-containing protein [Bacteroidota bacterium]MDX5469525.1 DHHA1 domain-containing protein [Bacteroidota bacterium]
YRPTIVLCKSGDKISGSARSVNGFDIHSAIEACEEHLAQFGGHTHAAGLVLRPEQVNGFKEAFDQVVKGRISEESLVPVITYDIPLPLSSVSEGFVKKMNQMAPFGPGNMNPVFVAQRVRDTGMPKVYGEHLSMNFYVQDGIVGAMAFSQAKYYDAVKQGKLFDICYHIDWTEFNGKFRMQLRILDMKPSTT